MKVSAEECACIAMLRLSNESAAAEFQGLEELRIHFSLFRLSASAALPAAAELFLVSGRIPEDARRDTNEFKCFKLSIAGAGVCPASEGREAIELRTLPIKTLSAVVLLAGETCWLICADLGGDCGSGGC